MIVAAQFPKKLRFLFEPSRYKVARGGRGSAKCFALGTKILMYDGTLKVVEDIVVGDKVMGPDSKPRNTLTLAAGKSEMYRVHQTSAADYVVNVDHILSLKKSKSCSKDVGVSSAGNPRRPNGRYPSYPSVVNIPIKDYLKKSQRWKDNFRGYRAGAINFPAQDVPVDPYLLGVWLGDGLHRELMITSADEEIITWLKDFSDDHGLIFTKGGKAQSLASDYRLGRDPKKHGRKNPVWQGFKELGLVSNKHIPQIYIANSRDIRLKLLAGLIDTDGTYARHGYSITSARRLLAEGIKRLADSLGYRTSIREKTTRCGLYRGVAWNISINGNVWEIPCRIKRKKYLHDGTFPNKDKTLSYISIEPIGKGEFAGFSVDGDHLFCLADGTVVHNSWSFARALLLMGTSKKLRILCAREVQLSIKQSVHKLLKDQIQKLKLDSQYTILETEIRGKNGTEFAFTGLSTLTVETIKSFEGYDIVWVEEGQTISKRSWDILIPTIRKDGSEIWISYNPDLETDETHQRFTVDPPPDCVNVLINWRDNPFFNEVLEQERLYCMEHSPDDYDNIWEGKCRPAVEGAIYYKEIQDAEDKGRICDIPYDPILKVFIILDLGWGDALAAGLIQKHTSEIRILEYLEASHTSLPAFSNELKKRQYNWGGIVLPHDGFSGQLNSGGRSTYDILTALGWNCLTKFDKAGNPRPLVEMSIEEGIRLTRAMFPRIYFNKSKCAAAQAPKIAIGDPFHHTELSHRIVECVKRYARNVNKATEAASTPMKNQYTHGADFLRYLCVCAEKLYNESTGTYIPKRQVTARRT